MDGVRKHLEEEHANQVNAELEAKVTFLEEENRRTVAEGAKFRKSFKNTDKAMHEFVRKAREKARMPLSRVSALPESKCWTELGGGSFWA